jgi:hypothetical protein
LRDNVSVEGGGAERELLEGRGASEVGSDVEGVDEGRGGGEGGKKRCKNGGGRGRKGGDEGEAGKKLMRR